MSVTRWEPINHTRSVWRWRRRRVASTRKVLAFTGAPWRGGLSLLADPGFAADRRLSPEVAFAGVPSDLAHWFGPQQRPDHRGRA
jgi:hypothetical protein